eukprot:15475789-Alexandrium_andersonii.AAC.1
MRLWRKGARRIWHRAVIGDAPTRAHGVVTISLIATVHTARAALSGLHRRSAPARRSCSSASLTQQSAAATRTVARATQA